MSSPSSNKGWHGEFIKVYGGDLGFLREYQCPDGVVCCVKRLEHIEDCAEEEARRFIGGSEDGLWSGQMFLNPEFLYNNNFMGISHIYLYVFFTPSPMFFIFLLFVIVFRCHYNSSFLSFPLL